MNNWSTIVVSPGNQARLVPLKPSINLDSPHHHHATITGLSLSDDFNPHIHIKYHLEKLEDEIGMRPQCLFVVMAVPRNYVRLKCLINDGFYGIYCAYVCVRGCVCVSSLC